MVYLKLSKWRQLIRGSLLRRIVMLVAVNVSDCFWTGLPGLSLVIGP